MQSVATAYFGQLEFDPSSVWEFPAGLPGFEEENAFVIVDQPQTRPLAFLQSLRTPGLCFICLPVGVLVPDYLLRPSILDLETIGLPKNATPRIGEDVICLALVTVDRESGATANLHSPLVLHLRNRLAVQAIQPETAYSLRHPVGAGREVASCSC